MNSQTSIFIKLVGTCAFGTLSTKKLSIVKRSRIVPLGGTMFKDCAIGDTILAPFSLTNHLFSSRDSQTYVFQV